jgi:hypothetical protein
VETSGQILLDRALTESSDRLVACSAIAKYHAGKYDDVYLLNCGHVQEPTPDINRSAIDRGIDKLYTSYVNTNKYIL